ncbi:hypothetical protein HK104_004043, partial [Borealophlyctis nickersoniae]
MAGAASDTADNDLAEQRRRRLRELNERAAGLEARLRRLSQTFGIPSDEAKPMSPPPSPTTGRTSNVVLPAGDGSSSHDSASRRSSIVSPPDSPKIRQNRASWVQNGEFKGLPESSSSRPSTKRTSSYEALRGSQRVKSAVQGLTAPKETESNPRSQSKVAMVHHWPKVRDIATKFDTPVSTTSPSPSKKPSPSTPASRSLKPSTKPANRTSTLGPRRRSNETISSVDPIRRNDTVAPARRKPLKPELSVNTSITHSTPTESPSPEVSKPSPAPSARSFATSFGSTSTAGETPRLRTKDSVADLRSSFHRGICEEVVVEETEDEVVEEFWVVDGVLAQKMVEEGRQVEKVDLPSLHKAVVVCPTVLGEIQSLKSEEQQLEMVARAAAVVCPALVGEARSLKTEERQLEEEDSGAEQKAVAVCPTVVGEVRSFTAEENQAEVAMGTAVLTAKTVVSPVEAVVCSSPTVTEEECSLVSAPTPVRATFALPSLSAETTVTPFPSFTETDATHHPTAPPLTAHLLLPYITAHETTTMFAEPQTATLTPSSTLLCASVVVPTLTPTLTHSIFVERQAERTIYSNLITASVGVAAEPGSRDVGGVVERDGNLMNAGVGGVEASRGLPEDAQSVCVHPSEENCEMDVEVVVGDVRTVDIPTEGVVGVDENGAHVVAWASCYIPMVQAGTTTITVPVLTTVAVTPPAMCSASIVVPTIACESLTHTYETEKTVEMVYPQGAIAASVVVPTLNSTLQSQPYEVEKYAERVHVPSCHVASVGVAKEVGRERAVEDVPASSSASESVTTVPIECGVETLSLVNSVNAAMAVPAVTAAVCDQGVALQEVECHYQTPSVASVVLPVVSGSVRSHGTSEKSVGVVGPAVLLVGTVVPAMSASVTSELGEVESKDITVATLEPHECPSTPFEHSAPATSEPVEVESKDITVATLEPHECPPTTLEHATMETEITQFPPIGLEEEMDVTDALQLAGASDDGMYSSEVEGDGQGDDTSGGSKQCPDGDDGVAELETEKDRGIDVVMSDSPDETGSTAKLDDTKPKSPFALPTDGT